MKTFLDWSRYQNAGLGDAYADIPKTGGNYAKAIAACIGSRQCEKKGKGVMCPSFRVTDDALQSTGGRVRLLKDALNGELGEAGMDDASLHAAMDLCVGCKGCKRECESEVDMATIKVEYLAQRQARHGVPRRSRLFAGVPQLLHRYPLVRRLPALRNRLPLLASLGERLLGISRTRNLPEPAAAAVDTAQLPATPVSGEAVRDVVVFIDSFNRYFDPENARAMCQVLTAAGYRLHFAEPAVDDSEPGRPLCCGRTLFAHGLVDEAREEARRMLNGLAPYLEKGWPVVGIEPSCVLSLRDEFTILGLGEMAEQLAANSMLLEEFLVKENSGGRLKLEFPEQPVHQDEAFMVHGHCHQKAVGATKSMRKVLKMIPGIRFTLVESSCCGMAGSFGLEAEHADLSRQMAEQSLLPALREVPEQQVVSNGFSCRQQIDGLLQRKPVHLAVLLRDALGLAD